MTLYNKDTIVCVYAFPKRESHYPHIRYLPEEKGFWGFGKRKEGLYIRNIYSDWEPLSQEQFETDHCDLYLEDKELYIRPHIEIHFIGKISTKRFFHTIVEMEQYLQNPIFRGLIKI